MPLFNTPHIFRIWTSVWHWFEWFPSKQIEPQHLELNCFVNCLFPLFQYFYNFCCHLNEIPLIFLVSWWVPITPSFNNPEASLILCIVVCRKMDPASWVPKKEMSLSASFLWSMILSVRRIILAVISPKVIEQVIFFLFSDVLLDILNADDALQSIFNLFISLTPTRVVMSIERLNFGLR